MDYDYVKIDIKGKVNYVKIIKHEETWQYSDFVISASIYADISALDVEHFTDKHDVIIYEEDFLNVYDKYKSHPDFQLKLVLKHKPSELSNNEPTLVSRQDCRFEYDMYISAQDLENFLLQTQNSFVLSKKIKSFETLKGLSDLERRAIIRESVSHLTSRYTYHPQPCHITALALAVVQLFPQLRTKNKDNGGIDALYDRQSNRGYIISRLNRVRQKLYITEQGSGKCSRKRNSAGSVIATVTKDNNLQLETDENFLILKNLNVSTQKDLIKQKLLDTLDVRREVSTATLTISKFSIYFPFFFTSPDLILYDFEIRFPKLCNNFINKWKICSPHIPKVFIDTKGPNFKYIPELEDILPSMRDLFYLINILPQVVAGKSSANVQREKYGEVLRKIVVFRKLNLTSDELISPELTNPYIIAEGENKTAISNYYVCIEKELIILPHNFSFIEAFDLLFKAHYIFGQHFDSSLKTFFTFISNYFYGMEVAGITTRIKEIASKLDTAINSATDLTSTILDHTN